MCCPDPSAAPWAHTNPHAQPQNNPQDLIPTHSPNNRRWERGWQRAGMSPALSRCVYSGNYQRDGAVPPALAAVFSLGQLQTLGGHGAARRSCRGAAVALTTAGASPGPAEEGKCSG